MAKSPRRALDFYETAPWMTKGLLTRLLPCWSPFTTVYEPCAGDQSIVHVVREMIPSTTVYTNDIDSNRRTDTHEDATQRSAWWRHHDLTVSNPPFNGALPIVQHAVTASPNGIVAMLLRLSFLEPTKGTTRHPGRATWLKANPPKHLIVTQRYSFTGNGKSDSVTTAWMIWSPICIPDMRPIDFITEEIGG